MVLLFVGICLISLPLIARAENPLVQTAYLTDPSPLVVKDENGEETIYVFTGHDEQRELNQGLDFTGGVSMRDWRLISSKDMVNWTDHGVVFDCKGHNGESNYRAWAPQCVMRPIQ